MTEYYLKVTKFSENQTSKGHNVFSPFVYYVFFMILEFYFSQWVPLILDEGRRRKKKKEILPVFSKKLNKAQNPKHTLILLSLVSEFPVESHQPAAIISPG